MRRRELFAVLGAAAWPVPAPAQQRAMPVIGFLNTRSAREATNIVAAFRDGLSQAGFAEGKTVLIEFRWAEGKPDQLPSLAADLVKRGVTVITATGGDISATAAKAATTTIPIVFSIGGDPVKLGLVPNFNRPGGNITGVSVLTTSLEAKRFGLLHDLMQPGALFGVLINPKKPGADGQLHEVQTAAATLGRRIHVLNASSPAEIDMSFDKFRELRVDALLVCGDPLFNNRREQLVILAARHRLPAIYEFREYAEAGGLMSYGTDLRESYRQVGLYTGRVLKGESPGTLPVVQNTKFELVINLRTARALDLEVPPTLIAGADEVIE